MFRGGRGEEQQQEEELVWGRCRIRVRYKLGPQFAAGGFGEVWRGARYRVQCQAAADCRGGEAVRDAGSYVMKRLTAARGAPVRQSGLREVHFGRLFARAVAEQQAEAAAGDAAGGGARDGEEGAPAHLVRFVESFESGGDLWLVFHHEGTSLHALMYTPLDAAPTSAPGPRSGGGDGGSDGGDDGGGDGDGGNGPRSGNAGGSGVQILQPSAWWWQLRTGGLMGADGVRELLRQALLALRAVHAENVTHRDVKPDNLLLANSSGGAGPRGAAAPAAPLLRLADFGSAVGAGAAEAGLYGEAGPGGEQQTREYEPPEATFDASVVGGEAGDTSPSGAAAASRVSTAYDMWSLGVVWLELILGTPHVFEVPSHTHAALARRLAALQRRHLSTELLLLLRGLMELCIYPPPPLDGRDDTPPPGAGGNGGEQPLLSWPCSDEALLKVIAERDPTRRGLPSIAALRLLRALLSWRSGSRPSAAQALRHAYFVLGPEQQRAACSGAAPASDRDVEGWC